MCIRITGKDDCPSTNTKVNHDNPVAKQRGSKLVIFDVTHLNLTEDEQLEFSMGMARFYDSNFWMNFKSVTLMSWIATVLIATLYHYKSYGKPKTAMSRWKAFLFTTLEIIDLGKDIFYLVGQPHKSKVMAFFFAQTIIIPFILNVWTTNVIKFTDENGNEKEIRELDLLIATARTQFHLGQETQGDQKDYDYPERRYRTSKNF